MTEGTFFKPPPHGRVNNWLGPEMATQLLDFARAQRDNFQVSELGDAANSRIDSTIRRSSTIKLAGELNDELRSRARAALPEMCRQLGSGPFKPGKFELEMVAHGDGAFFAEHRDTFIQTEDNRRAVSAVYYFHRLPRSFSGGDLRIYPIVGRERSKTFVEIEPINDTLVFFPSWVPHEVLPVSCPSGQFEDSRFAINCWVHSAS